MIFLCPSVDVATKEAPESHKISESGHESPMPLTRMVSGGMGPARSLR